MKPLFVFAALLAVVIMSDCHKKTTSGQFGQTRFDGAPAKEPVKFIKINFHKGSAKLAGNGIFELLTNLNLLRTNKITAFTVSGHSCEMDSDRANKRLSEQRADAVLNALWNFGIDTKNAEAAVAVSAGGPDCGYVLISEK